MGVPPLPAANRKPEDKILLNIMVSLVCQIYYYPNIVISDQPFQNILEHDVIEWTYVTSFRDDYILLVVTLEPNKFVVSFYGK